jgi:hypothetical protein
MRRVLVILLIFLFPLQAYADSLDCPVPAHAGIAGHAIFAGAADHGTSAFDLAANPDNPEELPADADLYDSLGSATQSLPVLPLVSPYPAYTPASRHLLFLPIIKPPPLA